MPSTIMKPDGKNGKSARFNKNATDANEQKTKKPFDKKAYRLKKYSNKYKVEQWEDRRKKAVLRGFYKDLERDNKNASPKPLLIPSDNPEEENKETQPKKKRNAFHSAKLEFQRKQEEKKQKEAEMLRVKAEREEALQKYKQKRMENYKKLSKKTRRGQPVMKDRLEMLLEKIQQTT
ncbi:thyroid transcription factor 1-associated protein 26 homolog [Diachasma alloeum]|uniref:thyroid transcription factor 1-associated protein 26 homolog n=1 Tax=Diachasma alloeum TaxID=454923 RepID=UPI0007384D40|nr:thyroid transcription factor 1-associated protein 26 homolog [Diachasma alloeum]